MCKPTLTSGLSYLLKKLTASAGSFLVTNSTLHFPNESVHYPALKCPVYFLLFLPHDAFCVRIKKITSAECSQCLAGGLAQSRSEMAEERRNVPLSCSVGSMISREFAQATNF